MGERGGGERGENETGEQGQRRGGGRAGTGDRCSTLVPIPSCNMGRP